MALTFVDILTKHEIDTQTTLIMRHRPEQPALARVLPWLADEHPDAFNAYQSTQNTKEQNQLRKASLLASFVASGVGEAVFVGMYEVNIGKRRSASDINKIPAFAKLVEFGFPKAKQSTHWFELKPKTMLSDYKGRLTIEWSGGSQGGRSWSRWSTSTAGNGFPIVNILESSILSSAKLMPDWDILSFSWQDLHAIPKSWSASISQWRGVYFILDTSDGKGYVGSAYGADNIWGRWINYAKTGAGGNKMLKTRDPSNFRFTILQRLSPDTPSKEVIEIENSWKVRLHTKEFGLNIN